MPYFSLSYTLVSLPPTPVASSSQRTLGTIDHLKKKKKNQNSTKSTSPVIMTPNR